MESIEMLMTIIAYGFEAAGLALLLIGLIGLITKEFGNNAILNTIYELFFGIEDDEDFVV